MYRYLTLLFTFWLGYTDFCISDVHCVTWVVCCCCRGCRYVWFICFGISFERRAVWLCENICVNEDNMTMSQEHTNTIVRVCVYLFDNIRNIMVSPRYRNAQKPIESEDRNREDWKIYLTESLYVADSFNFFYISSITRLQIRKGLTCIATINFCLALFVFDWRWVVCA